MVSYHVSHKTEHDQASYTFICFPCEFVFIAAQTWISPLWPFGHAVYHALAVVWVVTFAASLAFVASWRCRFAKFSPGVNEVTCRRSLSLPRGKSPWPDASLVACSALLFSRGGHARTGIRPRLINLLWLPRRGWQISSSAWLCDGDVSLSGRVSDWGEARILNQEMSRCNFRRSK